MYFVSSYFFSSLVSHFQNFNPWYCFTPSFPRFQLTTGHHTSCQEGEEVTMSNYLTILVKWGSCFALPRKDFCDSLKEFPHQCRLVTLPTGLFQKGNTGNSVGFGPESKDERIATSFGRSRRRGGYTGTSVSEHPFVWTYIFTVHNTCKLNRVKLIYVTLYLLYIFLLNS